MPVGALLRAGGDALLGVLLAPRCAACDEPIAAPLSGPVCALCWRSIGRLTPPFCERCGDPLPSWRVAALARGLCPRCRRRPSSLAYLRSAGLYEGSLRRIIHAYKYGQRRSLAVPLAALARAAAPHLLDEVDAAVPVPLHRRRRHRRGFNQARDLAEHLGVRVLDLLARTIDTPSQTSLPAARRHLNVRRAFRLRRSVGQRFWGRGSRGVPSLQSLTLLLVDDVVTTGATIEACAAVLREAGAREVRALTVARAAARSPA